MEEVTEVDRGGRKPEVGPHVPPPAHGAHIAAAIAALRVVQRRLDKQRPPQRSFCRMTEYSSRFTSERWA